MQPQQYPPQQQPYYPTPGAAQYYPPQPPQQQPYYPPQPSQQPPTQPQPQPGGMDPGALVDPSHVVNVARPALRDLGEGRLLIIRPIQIERGLPNTLTPGQLQDKMTCDLVVLDGPPFVYGGNLDEGRPHTHQGSAPFESLGQWINNPLVIAQCERSIGGGLVVGRLAKGVSSQPGRKAPWKLADPNEDDKRIAREYLAHRAVSGPPPPGVLLAPAPAPTAYPQQAQYWGPGAPQQPQQQPPYYPPQQQPAAPVQQPYPPQQQPQAWTTGTPAAPMPGAVAQPAYDTSVPPPGFDPNVWASFTPEQREQVYRSAAGPAPWR
jgi:hypothetical protein